MTGHKAVVKPVRERVNPSAISYDASLRVIAKASMFRREGAEAKVRFCSFFHADGITGFSRVLHMDNGTCRHPRNP